MIGRDVHLFLSKGLPILQLKARDGGRDICLLSEALLNLSELRRLVY